MNYLLMCSKCKRKMPHTIISMNFKRGALVKCCVCGNKRKNFINFKVLEGYEIK